MPRYRARLPQGQGEFFITDGGIETTLIFHYGLELPSFASFVLVDTPEGQAALRRYFQTYTDLARELGVGLVLESPTWRAIPTGAWGWATRPRRWRTSTAGPSPCWRNFAPSWTGTAS